MILGQWHTNKDMMMALITIFSGYGIFNMAGILGKKQTLDNILKEENNCVKVWYLYFQWASYWRAHWFENNPLLRKMLRTAPSINLTSPGHFFAYDEALETFGVKFVKQNVIRIPADREELKLRIKATQLEKERTEMLICDYIGDSVQSF
ncbi:hypothetical protein GLOIN_2v1787832 [Rhizophagus irregularis DAOM 181602=DAOM 197198]|nr:hypothetical protein GLOIN_2v1787832 [Rhizophagus irregularis DAOM 181602=DAOM 197198]